MATRYYIYIKDRLTYLSAVISGDSFPTTQEIQNYLQYNHNIFDNLSLVARRIVVHTKKSNLVYKANSLPDLPVWQIVPKPYGYDIDYFFDYVILNASILNRLFPNAGVIAKSDNEVLIGFIVTPSVAKQWYDQFIIDPFGNLNSQSNLFKDLNLSILILAARLMDVNITLQIYTVQIVNGINGPTNNYVLFQSIYITKDIDYTFPVFGRAPINLLPPRPAPNCGCSGY
jgi:hypothetical protein